MMRDRERGWVRGVVRMEEEKKEEGVDGESNKLSELKSKLQIDDG